MAGPEDKPKPKPLDEKYKKQRKYSAKKSMLTSDIGPLPGVVNKKRKEECRDSLQLFLETYFAEAFPLAWSPGHLEVIHSIEKQIETGGSVAIAMPRGSGKTTIIVRAALWALLYGKSPYAMIVAADAPKAENLLKSIKDLLRFNEMLFEDFPEACHPVRCLQGQAINANKQHLNGEFTLIDWKAKTAIFPSIEGSECSGARIDVAGVTAAARGAQHTLPDGRVIRPTLVLIDDFQTRESAASPLQSKTRLEIISGDLAGMKGPDQPLAMLAAITVIYPGDAAEQILDREENPEWRGVRQQMVEAWPDRDDLWETYGELLLTAKRNNEPPDAANQFYLDNREAMDAGHKVAWPERKEDDISAIQHAYNLRLRIGEEAFNAEYQNTPMEQDDSGVNFLDANAICAKLTGMKKGELPAGTEKIVAAIDVQSNHLWFGIAAWQPGFTGTLLDYGAFPKQNRRYYTKRTIPKSFADVPAYKGMPEEAAIYAALVDLLNDLTSRSWTDDQGAELKISRILIDEGYQTSTVHLAIRQSGHTSIAMPAKGVGIKATGNPMREWARRKGEPVPRNAHWRVRLSQGSKRSLRTLQWDTNFWKGFMHKRLLDDHGSPGCLAWWGENPLEHRLLAAHLDSQIATMEKSGGSMEVIQFAHKPNPPDDDLLDVLGMCCAAGSEQGLVLMSDERVKAEGFGDRLTLDEYLAKRKRSK